MSTFVTVMSLAGVFGGAAMGYGLHVLFETTSLFASFTVAVFKGIAGDRSPMPKIMPMPVWMPVAGGALTGLVVLGGGAYAYEAAQGEPSAIEECAEKMQGSDSVTLTKQPDGSFACTAIMK